jgi:hypothetical protein
MKQLLGMSGYVIAKFVTNWMLKINLNWVDLWHIVDI